MLNEATRNWRQALELPTPVDVVRQFLVDPRRRPELSPPEWELTLIDGPSILALGSTLRWRLRRAGLTQHLVTEITCLEPNRIVEAQRQGPLGRWIHTTRFEPTDIGTRVIDEIDFAPPGGLLGLALTAARIEADLAASFAVRDRRLRRLFPRVAGIVLCGGESRRMGRSKAWLPLGDELLLPRIARLVGMEATPVIVVAAVGQELPPLPEGGILVRDEHPGRGPLQGIATGLRSLVGQAEAAYVSACDAPFLQPGWIRRLASLLGDHEICVPTLGDHRHPLSSLYRIEVLETIDRMLSEDRRRVVDLLDLVSTRFVVASELRDIDPESESVRNLNSPDDLTGVSP